VIPGDQIEKTVSELGTTHVIWLPDTTLGQWEQALETSASCELLRVCREGEAWPLAAGLYLGGKSPLVMMQTTGLFESGDALRNVLFDLRIPLFALIGYRSYLVEGSPDTAKKFAEPILDAWGLKYELINGSNDLPKLVEHYRACQAAGKPGVGLIAEGAM
jgi:sulfopyruvate decarboxylase TPP-binding subunit